MTTIICALGAVFAILNVISVTNISWFLVIALLTFPIWWTLLVFIVCMILAVIIEIFK